MGNFDDFRGLLASRGPHYLKWALIAGAVGVFLMVVFDPYWQWPSLFELMFGR